MHNKTISKILVAIIMTSMLIAIIPTLPVGATTLASITPTSGTVGTIVTVIGTIDTLGGGYQITYDGTPLVTGNAPANSYAVNDTITIPSSIGSDIGLNHVIGLRDISTTNVHTLNFAVKTSRSVTATPTYEQEGNSVLLTITVTGGTVANQLNTWDLGVTDPNGSFASTTVSFTTSSTGSGSGSAAYVGTNLTGTYMVAINRTLPGIIPNANSTSFVIGLTDKTSYGRFETVNVQTAGWANNQNVTITILNTTGGVVQQWVNQNLTTGIFTGNWVIPWNAPMGTYTVTAVNATGNDKAIPSTQTFTVGSANLAVAYTVQPASASFNRTDTVTANFTISYPDATLMDSTRFSSLAVNVMANTTVVDTISLTTANYHSGTGTWQVSWKIPRNAALGIGYTFTVAIGDIADTNGNTGPTAAVASNAFAVTAAALTVMVTQQPAVNYTRTSIAMARINITYPDSTFFTDADLGSVLVRVYRNITNIANVTLVAANYNSTTNDWAVAWTSPYNAMLGTGYNFTVLINEAIDAANPNMGPKTNVTTNNFEILAVDILADSLQTDSTTYRPGEYVVITFVATYADGAPVVTGTSTVTLTAPDTFTTTTYNPVPTTGGTFAVTVWLSDAQAQVGSWTITLAVNGVNDGAGNTGPAAALSTNFTVLPSEVTLDSIMAAINDLEDRIDDIESDTSGLDSAVSSLITAITNLETNLQTQVDALGNTVATASEVAAVSSAVSSLSSDLDSLDSKLTALQGAVANAATDSDVAAVNAAVDALSTDLASLETSVADLNAAINAVDAASPADVDTTVDAAVSDISSEIGGLNTMVIVAVVLALIAAIAAILAVYIIQRKIAG